jgi:hypothetical protein
MNPTLQAKNQLLVLGTHQVIRYYHIHPQHLPNQVHSSTSFIRAATMSRPHRPTTRSMTAPTVRRSTRLTPGKLITSFDPNNNAPHHRRTHLISAHHPQHPIPRKQTKRVSKTSTHQRQFKHAHCTDAGKLDPSHNLSARESQLIQKEKQFTFKSRILEQQLASVSQKETEAAALLEECKNNLTTSTQRHLEDYFTCPL